MKQMILNKKKLSLYKELETRLLNNETSKKLYINIKHNTEALLSF